MKQCNCHPDFFRDGSGQLARYLKALDPGYAQVDERSISDLLVFARNYAEKVRFYDVPDSQLAHAGNAKTSWVEFFRRDMAVIAASIATVNTDKIKQYYSSLRNAADDYPGHASFGKLFKPVVDLAVLIDDWFAVSLPGHPLHEDLGLAIASNLKPQLDKLRAYEAGFLQVDPAHPLNVDYRAIRNKELWGLQDVIGPDASIYEGTTQDQKIRMGSLYVDDVFNSFFGFVDRLVGNSEQYLQYALQQYPAHQPHMALFISFLQLFKLAQQQVNELTGRILNFYYRDVLRLAAKPAIPDRAFVVFELAKDVASYHLPQGTPLDAGKDSGGKPQVYATETDLVVNQAKVKELKTLFVDKGTSLLPAVNGFYARPVANSADGFGKAFEGVAGKWHTFGKGRFSRERSTNPCTVIEQVKEESNAVPQSQIGFALASPQLVLQGGRRLVVWTFRDLEKFSAKFSEKNIEIWLSAEKGWMKLKPSFDDKQRKDLLDVKESDRYQFNNEPQQEGFFVVAGRLYIYLPVSAEAIIPFDPQLHPGYKYLTTFPVMQVMLGPEILLDYKSYEELSFVNQELWVKVGSINPSGRAGERLNMDGLKKLLLKNDEGLIAPGKPFDPFTAYPLNGMNFFIGSDEVFNKPIDHLSVNVEFMTKDGRISSTLMRAGFGMVRGAVLDRREWKRLHPKDKPEQELTMGDLTLDVLDGQSNIQPPLTRTPLTYNSDFNESSLKGFIRLENIQTDDIFDASDLFERIQKVALQLKIKEISVSYSSILREFDPKIDQFFHVYPFGIAETLIRGKQYTDVLVPIVHRETLTSRNTAERLLARADILSGPDAVALEREVIKKDPPQVDALQKLLPQFTYVSPYAELSRSPVNIRAYKRLLEKNADLDWSSEMVPRIIGMSGIRERLDGKKNQYSGSIQEEGILYIGLEYLLPLQSVSLLFQFAEGSAEDEDNDPPPVHWSYLSGNEWRPLQLENIVSDRTYGLQATGIIKLDVPSDANLVHTIVTDGLVWFAASVTSHPERFPMLINVVAQAVETKFEDHSNDDSHFDQALPAGSIGGLVTKVEEVSTVSQPFASFDGKSRESGRAFYTRVSERLRHKARAVTPWDYEHLVLNRFHSIYKVKAIPHTDPNCICRHTQSTSSPERTYQLKYNADKQLDPLSSRLVEEIVTLLNGIPVPKAEFIAYAPDGNLASAVEMANKVITLINLSTTSIDFVLLSVDQVVDDGPPRTIDVKVSNIPVVVTRNCCGPQVSPGHVLVIPIANLKNRNAVDILRPKTSRMTMIAIRKYLEKRTSPFVKVHVRNPLYEQVQVQFKVQFRAGVDKGYHLKKLNDEIVRFLTPWAFDENVEVKFGQKIYASAIINFIEERSYVDFITEFLMYVCRDTCCPPTPEPERFLVPAADALKSTSWFAGKDEMLHAFSELCGCSSVEVLIEDRSQFAGEVVARPSSARAILVSAPQHLIIPYDPPEVISPCEARSRPQPPPSTFIPGDLIPADGLLPPIPFDRPPRDAPRAATREASGPKVPRAPVKKRKPPRKKS